MTRRKLYNSLFILLYWIVSVNFLATFSLFGVRGFMKYAEIEPSDLTNKMAIYWISPGQYVEGMLSGLFFGLLFLFINFLSDRYHWDRLGFGRLILVKSASYGLGLVVIFFSVFLIVDTLGYYPEDVFTEVVFDREIFIIALMVNFFIAFQIILLNYVIQTNRKIGDFSIISFLTGKYREPVLEDRLFMFVDLKSSTTLAEKLGDLKYSQLLRDCFRDFNYSIKFFPRLDINQYVGDEVVVTTKWQDDRNLQDLVKFYFRFRERIERRNERYKKNYGVVPFFKAGIHGGTVSVTEIGTLKRDIAFHGDVMNTASRIQGLCNQLNQPLLISSTVAPKESLNGFDLKEMGNFELRGREANIPILAVTNLKISKSVADSLVAN